jgi:flagellar P-ring protein precursor FlgI
MKTRRLIIILLAAAMAAHAGTESRVKDLVNVEGIRDNQLLGYGLVVGLNGTGDKRQTVFSAQSLTNLLSRMGVQVSPSAILVRNTAAVLVAATLPAFAQPGSKMDITVAAIGDASNLQGGLLVMTPLKGPDGQVYAVAQGSVVTGGFVAGGGGSKQTVNHPTAGRIPSGAIIERNSPSIEPAGRIKLQLRQSDHTSASRIVRVINARFPSDLNPVAKALNSGLVVVDAPSDWKARPVEFISELEELPIDSDQAARVVVNERTGTIVMGRDVAISPVTILHGSLTVEVTTNITVSQPAPLSSGKTTSTPQTTTDVKAEPAKNVNLKQGATVEDLVRGLVAIGSTPRDIIAVLQALKAAGALQAELEII